MADFREVLEISRNKECKNFLHYDWCKTKYDLSEVNEGTLENPPMEIDFGEDETVGTIADMIDEFCESTAVARAKLRGLFESGNQKCRIVIEY